MIARTARPTLLFVLLAAAVCALLNPGNFGSVDTARRWQVARSILWGEPAVTPADARQGFGIPGRYGARQAWYGIGQSLFLMPVDALVTTTVAPVLRRSALDPLRQRQIVELTVAFVMQTLLTACVLLLAHRLLLAFDFTNVIATAGALVLVFATTALQYIQCAQENELLLALALAALVAIRAWHHEQRARWPLLAGLACGFAILVRLPSLLETAIFALFAITAGRDAKRFLAWFAPPVAGALLVDRWYQWYRFGDVFSTYIGLFGKWNRGAQPASFPFSYPFWKGFLGVFFSLDKSVFLFDPLLILVLLLAVRNWRSLGRNMRCLFVCLALLLIGYSVAYARYYDFGGDVAWGHRFVLLPVQLLCLFAAPLLFTRRRRALWAVVAASLVLQIASTVISPNVEVIQRTTVPGHSVLWNRAVNLVQLIANRQDPWRLVGVPVEWRTVAYLPFQLTLRFPRIAIWATAVWIVLLLLAAVLVCLLVREALRQDAARTAEIGAAA